jgi:hypothetical protein
MKPKELLELIKADIPAFKQFLTAVEANPQLEQFASVLFPKLAPIFEQVKPLTPYLDHVEQIVPYIDFLEQVLTAAGLS